jgi:hypothetical protein
MKTTKFTSLLLLLLLLLAAANTFLLVKSSKDPAKGIDVKKLVSYNPDKSGPVPKEKADAMMRDYRENSNNSRLLKMVSLISHDYQSFSNYVSNVFTAFVRRQTPVTDRLYPGYNWEVGIYFILSQDGNEEIRLSCCLIPTLAKREDKQKKATDIKDYFELKDNAELYPPDDPNKPENFYIYDTGEIWPG